MNMSPHLLYNDFPTFLRKYFPYKVQKISLNAGFTCPNRDGTKGWGGCTYCNNQTFNPDYCRTEKSLWKVLSMLSVPTRRKVYSFCERFLRFS